MIIKLKRTFQNKHSTVGELFVDDKHICVGLEDAWHMVKLPGITRIPAGTYPVKLRKEGGFHNRYSERFGDMHKGMLHIADVPQFEHVLIHCGNYVSDTRGCILVGSTIVEPEGLDTPYTVLASEKAYRELYPIVAAALLAGDKVWFQAIDPKKE